MSDSYPTVDDIDCESADVIHYRVGGSFIAPDTFETSKGNCYGSIAVAALLMANKDLSKTFTLQLKKCIQTGGLLRSTVKNNIKKHKIYNVTLKTKTINSQFKYTVDFFTIVSAEHIYNGIRYHVFPDKDEDSLKSLFIKMVTVPIRHKLIIPYICDALNKRNFNALCAIIDKCQICTIENQLLLQGYEKKYKINFERIFDIYFSIKDRDLSLRALMDLIFLGCISQRAYDTNLDRIESFDNKEKIISKIIWSAFKI